MDCCALIEQLVRRRFYGAVKFVFDKGELRQCVESLAIPRESVKMGSRQEAEELLHTAQNQHFTGYIVVAFLRHGRFRVSYVRTHTAGDSVNAMSFDVEQQVSACVKDREEGCHEAQRCLFFQEKPKRRWRRWTVKRKDGEG